VTRRTSIARHRLSKYVQTNTEHRSGVLFGPVLRLLLGSSQLANGGLGSDHVGTLADMHTTIDELYFLCVVRAEDL
jgi:hypothetical protein